MKARITDPQAVYPISSVEVEAPTLDDALEIALAAMFGCDPQEVDDEVFRQTLMSLKVEEL